MKQSANWIGSGTPFHPHELLFFTTEDGQFALPARSRLSFYVEHNYADSGRSPLIAFQDALNIDTTTRINQYLVNVTENRGVHGCNGNGDAYNTACFRNGTFWTNEKSFRLPRRASPMRQARASRTRGTGSRCWCA